MRKVAKKDEIPVRFLEESAIQKRLSQFDSRKTKKKTLIKMKKLFVWLESQEGRKIDATVLIKRIYNDIDYFMESEIYANTVCAKGCAHCCKVPVQVSLLEAHYIARKTKIPLHRPSKNRYEILEGVDTYCPLLDQKSATCKAYQYRPLACRIFATIDHWKHCEDVHEHHYIHCFESQEGFKNIHNMMIMSSQNFAKKNNLAAIADIRDWFGSDKYI